MSAAEPSNAVRAKPLKRQVPGPLRRRSRTGLVLPPTNLLEAVRLVFVLLDLVQLGIEATWDFEARVELGLLHGPQTGVSLPTVPSPSTGYY